MFVFAVIVCLKTLQISALTRDSNRRQQVYSRCPNGSVAHDNSCYMVGHELVSWIDALGFCEAYGAHLVRIESESEQQFIAGYIKSILSSTTDPIRYYWLGGTDAISEGEWFWAKTVERLKYTNWGAGQPDNSNAHSSKHQDCLAMYGQTGDWDDGWCEDQHNFICEFDLTVDELVG